MYKQIKFQWQSAKITEKVRNVLLNVIIGNRAVQCYANQIRRRSNNEYNVQSIDFVSPYSSSSSEQILEAPLLLSIERTSEAVAWYKW